MIQARRHPRESGGPRRDVAPSRGFPLPRERRQAGFSLLEVLVAFVVLAVVGTVLSQLYSASLRNAAAAEEWSRAVLVAEGQLQAAAAVTPLKEGSNAGTEDDGRIAWSSKVETYVPADTSPDLASASAQLPLALMRVSVTVNLAGADGAAAATGSGRSITLSTLKLVRKDLLS